jgi:D-alanyl-D-alanine carboxypeptidase
MRPPPIADMTAAWYCWASYGVTQMARYRDRALAILVMLALGSGYAAAQDNSAFAEQAALRLASYAEYGLFSGSIIVAKGGQVLLRESFGLANHEWDIPNTPQTRFRLGSITKQFTAAAILQLQEAGLLNIDDPVSEYYEEAPPEWQAITIRHLLTHTSGIPSYTAIPDFFRDLSRVDRTPQEIIELTQGEPLNFVPGTEFEYDNSGYVLLGYIIEKVSGQSYSEYLLDHVFGPLGMHASGYDNTEAILQQRASGYRQRRNRQRLNREVENARYLAMSLPHAAGGLYSTVEDLLIWDQALYAGGVVEPASMEAMFTDYGHGYGFGWLVNEKYGGPIQSHGGGINGFRTAILRFPEEKLTVIVLANLGFAPSDEIAMGLAGLYFGDFQLPVEVPVDPSLFEKYVGRYKLTTDSVVTVFRRGDDLYSRIGTGPEVELFARNDVHFFVEGGVVDYIFQLNGNERAGALIHRVGVRAKLAPRIE